MDKIILNRSKDWEREDMQKRLLHDVQTLYKIREMMDVPDMLLSLTDFILDQFPGGERDLEDGHASDAWWDASFAFEKGIPEYSLDEFYQLARRRLEINEEDEE